MLAFHLSAWRRLLDQDREQACIVIEDDLILAADFADAVASLQNRNKDFLTSSILALPRGIFPHGDARGSGRYGCMNRWGRSTNAWGYSVTRQYVRRFFGPARRCDWTFI